MIDGGQQITSIDHHLLTGNELFDTDPKGALAAYYQAVSLEPTHVEGWNQIGRLMFDMQQYAEAEMVFRRVEQLSLRQGLDDWAEMAAQNIELTRQTLSQRPVIDQAGPAQVANDASENDPGQGEASAELLASEENKSIVDISNIAAATQFPNADETVLLQPEAVQEMVENTVYSDQPVEAQSLEMAVEPTIASPIMKASAQTIEIVDELDEVDEPVSALPPVPAPPASADPVLSAAPSEQMAPTPVAPNLSESLGEFAPAIEPAMPMTQVPFEEHQNAAVVTPAAPSMAHAPIANAPLPNMPIPNAPMPNAPLPNRAMPMHAKVQAGLPVRSPLQPPVPFPAHGDGVLAASLAGDHRAQMQAPPSMVPPTAEVAMEAPKSSSGKIALMITGVVGAVGIGIGVAQYLNTEGPTGAEVPIVKSEVKLEPNTVVTDVVVPVPEKVEEVVTAALAAPKILDQDRAYKAGMTHLVKGEFIEARPFLEKAVEGGHAEAAFNLASLYAKGDGVEQNYETAISYLQKASDAGYYPAMTNLGLLYAKGQGVKQNYLRARSLWLKAAAGEHADAMHNLAVIYATGKGVEKDMGEAIKWYRKGANGGYVDSIFDLGLLYANGDGVPRDYPEAKRLWETAASKGHKLAAKNLVKLNKVMTQ